MKIAVLTDEFPPVSRGGSGVVAYREAVALAKNGHEVRVFVPSQTSNVRPEEITIHYIKSGFNGYGSWRSIYDRSFLNSVKQDLKSFKPDVVHCHHVTNHIGLKVVEWCAQNWRTIMTVHDANLVIPDKVFVGTDGGYVPGFWGSVAQYRLTFNPLLIFFASRVLKKLHKVIFVSDAIRDYYVSVFGENPNFFTLHNALDLNEWAFVPLTKKGVQIGFASRPTEAKGWNVFVQTLRSLSELGAPVTGSVIGDQTRIGRVLEKLSKEEKRLISYCGSVLTDAGLKDWYSGLSAIFVGSLYVDPFPNVTIEAMAVGRGAIVGPYTGSREIVDETTGYLMSPDDIVNIAEMAKKISDVNIFSNWSKNTLNKRADISMETHLKRLIEIYDK